MLGRGIAKEFRLIKPDGRVIEHRSRADLSETAGAGLHGSA
jgi:hypothetical protein